MRQTIKLTIVPNSHRVSIGIGDLVNLFCRAKYNFMRGKIYLAGITIQPFGVKLLADGDSFEIDTIDAARLLNRLTKRKFSGSINLASPSIQNKWDANVSFAAKDFE